jgi:hypothetical protein
MESAFPSRNMWKDPCATLVRMDGVILEVRNRKEGCCHWSLVATTGHILALKLTASLRLVIESLFIVLNTRLTSLNSACIWFPHKSSVLLGSCLSSSHTVVIPQPSTILFYWCSCIAYFEWVLYMASVHSQAVWSWSQLCTRISLLS